MKEWYTAQELAQAALPELPGTVSAIIRRAKKSAWPARPREFGKGLEYPLTALPADAQAALIARETPLPAPLPLPAPPPPKPAFDPLVKAAGDAAAAQLQGRAKARLDAKLTVLDALKGLTGRDLMAAVVRYNAGELPVPAAVRAQLNTISLASVHRWREQTQRLGLSRVAGRYGNRKGSGLIDVQPQLAAALRGLIVEYPHVRPGFAAEFLSARYQDSDLTLPRPMTVRRWLSQWKHDHAELYCRLRDPDAWKSRYMLAWGDASAGIERLNQEWQADSTPADLLLAGGQRHSLLFLIDVYSRRVLIQVSKTSKATAIAALLRRALLEWGLPEILKTDNGQDYTAHHIDRICQALAIDHQLSAPFSPWQKPHVERVIGTFARDLVEVMPGYIGHSVAEREQLRARQQFSDRLFVKNSTIELATLTPAELQAFCNRWCEAYHVRPHGGEDMRDQSPLAKAAAWRAPIRVLADERVLDLLLAEAPGDGWRTVSKADGVSVDGYHYDAPELALYVRQRVRVLYDPEGDLGQIWCFNDKGQFITVARCRELDGINAAAVARNKIAQRQNMNEQAKAARAEARKLETRNAVEEVMAQRAADADRVVAFPAPTVVHVTPHIEGAQAALRGDNALGPDGPTPELLKALDLLPASPPPKPAPVIPLRNYDNEYAAMRDLIAASFRGEPWPDEVEYAAEFYRENPRPRHFEGEMAERYGFERYRAWKAALLARAPASPVVSHTA